MSGGPGVVVGAHGAQAARERAPGLAAVIGAHVSAVAALARDDLVRVEVWPGLPVPPGLRTAGRPVVAASAYGAAPDGDGPLVFHVTDLAEEWPLDRLWPHWARRSDVALAVTLVDLGALRCPPAAPAARDRVRMRTQLAAGADAVLTLSEATAADAEELLGVDSTRLHPVLAGAPEPPYRGTAPALARAREECPGLREGFLLGAAGPERRHNLGTLLDGYARLSPALRARHQLVPVGCADPVDARADVAGLAAALGVEADVLVAPRLSSPGLAALHAACALAICPAAQEGFGLAAVRALQAGAAVLASDIPAHRELVADPRARFDPADAGSLRDRLTGLLQDEAAVARLRAAAPDRVAAWSWPAVAERTLSAYEAAAAARARRVRPGRLRGRRGTEPLAVVSPLPPDRTGIATHTGRLVAELAARGPVEAYSERSPSGPPPAPGVPVRSVRELPWRRATADARRPPLFCLGNSADHIRTWLELGQLGGDVLLHDVWLVDFYRALLYARLLPDKTFEHLVWRLEGDKLPPTLRRVGPRPLDRDACRLYGITFVGDVVDRARRILVFSDFGRGLVVAERPDRADDVRVVPHGIPRFPAAPPPTGPPLVTTFGFVKHGRLLVEAAARVLQRVPEARFAFGGQIRERGPEARLRARMAARGLTDRFRILAGPDDDWLSAATYRRLLGATTVAVQLREQVYGEVSGSTSDCLGAGIPTVVNGVGTQQELPDSVVVKISRAPTADEVADAIVGLLLDAPRRASLRRNALEYGAAYGFDVAAARVLEALA